MRRAVLTRACTRRVLPRPPRSHTKICFQKDVDQKGNEWKGDFNRLVSGMHSTVAASIVRDMEARGDTELAMAEYRRRLRDEPAAVANLHFTYMLVLCAVADMRERLDGCSSTAGSWGDM